MNLRNALGTVALISMASAPAGTASASASKLAGPSHPARLELRG